MGQEIRYVLPLFNFSLYIWKSEGISFSLGQLSHIDLFSRSPGHQECGLRKHIGHKNIVPYTFNFASQIGNSGMWCHHVASGSLCILNYTLMVYVCLQWSVFVNFDAETFLGNMNVTLPLNFTFTLSTAKCSESVPNLAQAWFRVSDIILSPHNLSYCLSLIFQIVCKIKKPQFNAFWTVHHSINLYQSPT